MNDDAIQTIIMVISLLVGLAVLCAPLLLFFVYVFFQTSKRKRIRQKMLTAQAQFIGNHQWVPVRYASEPQA